MSVDAQSISPSKPALKKVIDIEIITTENGCRKIVAPLNVFATANSMTLDEKTVVIDSLKTLACSSSVCNDSLSVVNDSSMSQKNEQPDEACIEDATKMAVDPIQLEEIMEIEDSNSPALAADASIVSLTTEEIQSIIHVHETPNDSKDIIEEEKHDKQHQSEQCKRKTRGNTMENIRKVIKLEQTNNELLLKDEEYNSGLSSAESDQTGKKANSSSSDSGKDAQDWNEALDLIKETQKDAFCWTCHKPINKVSGIVCSGCPRAFHTDCIQKKEDEVLEESNYQCIECVDLSLKESFNNNKNVNPIFLKSLLLSVYNKIMAVAVDTPFAQPNLEKNYRSTIVNPMDTSKVYDRIKTFYYKSLQRFLSDINWILHNSMIFYRNNKKIIKQAKDIVNICTQEIKDMKNCPTCYHNSSLAPDWFTRPCPSPHMVVWARLKGFPFWPAKVMSHAPSGSLDVRFFGEHDRAWINKRDCLLYSKICPKTPTPRGAHRTGSLTNNLEIAVNEANVYFENLKQIHGEYNLAMTQCQFDPTKHGLKTYFPNFGSNNSSKENVHVSTFEATTIKTEPADDQRTPEPKLLPPLKLKLSNLTHQGSAQVAPGETKVKIGGSKLDIRRSKRFAKTGKKRLAATALDANGQPTAKGGGGGGGKVVRPLVIRLEQCRFKQKNKKLKTAQSRDPKTNGSTIPLAPPPLIPLAEIKQEPITCDVIIKEEPIECVVAPQAAAVEAASNNSDNHHQQAQPSSKTLSKTTNPEPTTTNNKGKSKKTGTLSMETRRARLAKYTKRKLNVNNVNHANGDFSDEIPAAKRLLLSALNIRQVIKKPNKCVQTERTGSSPATLRATTRRAVCVQTQTDETNGGDEQVVDIMYKFLSSFPEADVESAVARRKIADVCDKIVVAVRNGGAAGAGGAAGGEKCRCSCSTVQQQRKVVLSDEYRRRVVDKFRDRFDMCTARLVRTIKEVGEECIADEVSQMKSDYEREVSVAKNELYATIETIKRRFLNDNK